MFVLCLFVKTGLQITANLLRLLRAGLQIEQVYLQSYANFKLIHHNVIWQKNLVLEDAVYSISGKSWNRVYVCMHLPSVSWSFSHFSCSSLPNSSFSVKSHYAWWINLNCIARKINTLYLVPCLRVWISYFYDAQNLLASQLKFENSLSSWFLHEKRALWQLFWFFSQIWRVIFLDHQKFIYFFEMNLTTSEV